MGKVLSTFTNGWPGSISRSVDDIVITRANGGTTDILPGKPVFLDTSTGKVKAFANGMTFSTFVGFAVRTPSKTPDSYGESVAAYKPNEPVDILVRGTIVVETNGTISPGGNVHARTTDGTLVPTPIAEGGSFQLTNCHFRGPADSSNRTELVITERNLV